MKKLIQFKNIVKNFDGNAVLKGINLDIYENEFVTLLGPSGCGKTTLLRILGGFLDQDQGEIIFDGQEISGVPAYKREINTVFQKYALFPHMNVYDNMALGLRLRDLPRTVIDSRVKTAADFFGISAILTKKIRTISDAERQRVALGRAVVCQPKVLLVDEDFARQDDGRRREMLEDIVRINRELKITVLYVTNKYEEAVSLDARVIFMKDGRITDDRHFHQTDET